MGAEVSSTTPSPAADRPPAIGQAQAQRLNAYADPWTTPAEAFYDIYDLLPRLIDPHEHLQLDGRRGTGKTVLIVNAYLRAREQFESSRGSPPYTVAIYVDLSQDVGVPRDQLPMVRGVVIFQQILRLILTVTSRPGHRRDRRFWGLQDYLDERPQWFKRLFGRWRLDRYRNFVDRFGDEMARHPLYQQIYTAMQGQYTAAPKLRVIPQRVAVSSKPAQPRALPPTLKDRRGLPSIVFEKRLLDMYRVFGNKLEEALTPLLDAMDVEHLILYLDEWSGPSVGSDTQPYLFEQLANTFTPGGRVTLKMATVPGATRLAFPRSTTRLTPLHLDRLADFQPHWLRRRLLRMLILNLAASVGPGFPLARYLSGEQEQAGFPAFVQDVFQNDEAGDELIQASEGLPRQMLLVFISALQLQSIYAPRKRLSASMIRMAARQLFSTQFEVSINHDRVVNELFGQILKAGKRVVDVERLPVFYEALDWLVNEGVMFRCGLSSAIGAASVAGVELGTTLASRLQDGEPLLRYKLSYPVEIYRMARAYGTIAPVWYDTARVEQVTNAEHYPDAPQVNLSELATALFEPAADAPAPTPTPPVSTESLTST